MKPYVSTKNSTYLELSGGATFTGVWEDVSEYISVVTSCKSDVSGTLYMEFTDNKDDTTADSSLSYAVAAGLNEVHKLTITAQYYRTKYINGTDAQTTFKIQALVGQQSVMTAPLNLPMGQDSDSIVVRSVDSELDIGEGKRSGYHLHHKFGQNPNIGTGTTPEDVWYGGGEYTGFPTGSAELITVASASASDTLAGVGARSVMIYGLDASGLEQNEIINLSGTTLADSVNTYTRCHRITVHESGSSIFNVGDITAAHKVTTANIFSVIPAGFNQSQVCAITVPANKTSYLRKLVVTVDRSNTAVIHGGLWIRENGHAPRIARIFSGSQSSNIEDIIYGGIELPALTDITVRITDVSANSTIVTASFDLIEVND